MENIRKFFEKDKFAKHCGIELLDISPGSAKARMELTQSHLNGLGMGHGGAIFTLADLVFAVAANSHGTVAVAININISYLKAAAPGMIYAEAMENSIGPKIASYTINVTDSQNNLLAIFNGMAYRKKDSIEA